MTRTRLARNLASDTRFAFGLIAVMLALPLRSSWSQSTTADTVAVLHEVWAAVALSTRKPAVLWIPRTDTAHVVPISAAIREELRRQRIPVSDYQPAGDDTVVYRITSWKVDSAGVIVKLASEWKELIGQGARRCRAKSGNIEQFLVRREYGVWVAQEMYPIMHGDGACLRA